jgi:alkylation response protein AidB-like acyl-CoA dehydrogenase
MTAPTLTEELQSANDETVHPIPDPALPTNFYLSDQHLQLALARYYRDDPEGWRWSDELLREWGAVCAQQITTLYEVAEKNGPTLKQYDRRGERVDELIFHPAYHEIGQLVYGYGLAAMSNRPGFRGLAEPASQLAKFVAMFLFCQAEGSISCPLSMTDIMARVLNKFAAPEVRDRYLPRLTSLDYRQLYTGAMFMTEKVGGSDVGATTTTARPAGDHWELNGDKWFCSNVGADLILTLARPEGAPAGTRGLGLFLVPRLLPDGQRNSYLINRLKDKLGTRAMASGEVTLQNTFAYQVGPLERGFVNMMEMVNGTRLHSGVGGAASLRRAVIEATLHARERRAFGQRLSDQPLIAAKLADMIVDSEATTSLVLATAHHLDRADRENTSEARILSRLLIALLKRYATDHGVQGAQAALELRGGNGYIEDWPNARILRDAYVNIIWEGGINMVSFEVLRTLDREGAWPLYAASIRQELSGIAASQLTGLKEQLQTTLTALEQVIGGLAGQSRANQEIIAPQLAGTMAALYAATLLAAEAGFSLQRDPANLRPVHAAERYRASFLQPAMARLELRPDYSTSASELIDGAV